jgi:hypothetical protein
MFDRHIVDSLPGPAERLAAANEPKVGDPVMIVGGPYHRSKGVLEAIGKEPTPAGFKVQIAKVKRPRSTVHVFVNQVVGLPGETPGVEADPGATGTAPRSAQQWDPDSGETFGGRSAVSPTEGPP